MAVHYNCIHWGIYGMVREHFPQVAPEALFGKIFQVGEFARTQLPAAALRRTLRLCIPVAGPRRRI